MKVGAVVLAAGGSRRFGTGGENKLLFGHPSDGTPVILVVCHRVAAAGFQPVVAVTGYQSRRVRKVLEEIPIMMVHNARWKEGMSGSIGMGAERIKNECDGIAIVLGDMPRLSVETLSLLKNRFESLQGRFIVYPTFRESQGNPVIFPQTYFPDILASTGDRGCKGVLEDHRENAVSVPVPSDEVVIDYDTVSDYGNIMKGMEVRENG